MRHAYSRFASCVVGLVSPALAGVLVVDPASPSAYSQIQAAVTAAANGDVVLVKSGTYGPVTIDHKGVTVIADVGAVVFVDGGIRIVDTLVQHPIVLRGIRAKGRHASGAFEEGLRLDTARGQVRIEDCRIEGADGNDFYLSPTWGGDAVGADVALNVAFSNCKLQGGKGKLSLSGGITSRGGDGLEFRIGAIALYDCTLIGGTPMDGDDIGDGAPGGDGLAAHDDPSTPGVSTQVYASQTTFVGADGSIDFLGIIAGDGGDGAWLDGPSTSGTFRDCSFDPGVKGWIGSQGVDGVALHLTQGAVAQFETVAARLLHGTSPVRSGQLLVLDVKGAAGDQAFLLIAGPGTWFQVPGVPGVFHAGVPVVAPVIVPLGLLGASGLGTFAFPVPPLSPALLGVTIQSQLVVVDANQATTAGGASSLVLLDPAF